MLRRLTARFSTIGLITGLLFLCGSLTPSLLPRVPEVQGVLCGFAFAVGYGVGMGVHFLWWLLEFKEPAGRARQAAAWIAFGAVGGLTVYTFSRTTIWQNSIRQKMEMTSVESAYPWMVALIALIVAFFLIVIVWAIIRLAALTGTVLARLLPRRMAIGLGAIVSIILLYMVVDNFVIQKGLRAADAFFAAIDQHVDVKVQAPAHVFASGGPGSVIAWRDIGANGKKFLTSGPDRAGIAAFTGRSALEPVRVYAGFDSGDDFDARAAIALQDLINMGGFDRSVLIVATPTGTGWLDPAAMEPVAYMHGGDLAIVATQYTYVPSWLSIMAEPDRSRLASRALFNKVYDHWADLPKDNRPDLYLFGLSLGALASEASVDFVSMFTDPINGAFWAGPPFPSTIWADVTANRNAGSPAWLPEFRQGELVRFMNQDGIASPQDAEWGPMRLLYLQHASDPMVFFSPDLAFNRPDWLGETRGKEVSEYFDWYPLVTFLQVGFDLPMAESTPSGYGHTYDAIAYIRGWIEVTEPKAWVDRDTERLNSLFANFRPPSPF